VAASKGPGPPAQRPPKPTIPSRHASARPLANRRRNRRNRHNRRQLEDVLSPELRAQHYSALDPAAVAAALDRYREVPSQSKKQPAWPSKKAADAVAGQLRGQMVAGAAGQRALEGL
jgi:hypothetical protein